MRKPSFFKTIPGNEPLDRPGVYCLRHVPTGKYYVGASVSVRKRLLQHAKGSCKEVRSVIEEFGADSFEAIPLCYSIRPELGKGHLFKIEEAYIAELGSMLFGFNTAERDVRIGPSGVKFAASVKRGLSPAEIRQKMAKSATRWQSLPEAKKRKQIQVAEQVKRRERDPVFLHRRLESLHRLHSDEAIQARRIERSREANRDPDRRRKISNARSGGMWVHNGVEERFVPRGALPPEGFVKGRKPKA